MKRQNGVAPSLTTSSKIDMIQSQNSSTFQILKQNITKLCSTVTRRDLQLCYVFAVSNISQESLQSLLLLIKFSYLCVSGFVCFYLILLILLYINILILAQVLLSFIFMYRRERSCIVWPQSYAEIFHSKTGQLDFLIRIFLNFILLCAQVFFGLFFDSKYASVVEKGTQAKEVNKMCC